MSIALGAGLPTPPLVGPPVSPNSFEVDDHWTPAGDLRSSQRRGQQTRAEREHLLARFAYCNSTKLSTRFFELNTRSRSFASI